MSVQLRPSPPCASVVSTASTRPLYGRGAGSTPAGGSSSYARSSAERALFCDGRGRWFESSRAYLADVAQRKSTGAPLRGGLFDPGRPLPVVPDSSGPWCNGSTTSSNLVGPGSHPIAVLAALRTYAAGRGARGRGVGLLRWRGRHPPGPGSAQLPPRLRDRGAADLGRHGLERLLDRRLERPGDARRRRL